MAKPDITIVHPNLDLRGGAERKILLLQEALSKAGYRVTNIVNSFDRQKTFTSLLTDSIKIICYPGQKLNWLLRTVIYLVRSEAKFVVISNYPANIPASIAGLLRPSLKLYWICNEVAPALASDKNGSLWQVWFLGERFLSRRIDYFVANSDFTAKEIFKYYRRSAEVIRSGVELRNDIKFENCREEVLNLKDFRFWFTVTRIEHHKNLQLIIDLALARPDELFVVGGMGADMDWLISEARLIPGLKVLGAISDDEKFFLMRIARGFLFLPIEEPLGVTVMEAIYQGTAVVAYNSGGPKEVVLNGKNGVLVENYKEYLNALSDPIFKKPNSEEYFSSYIGTKFSNQRMLRDFVQSIKSVIGN